VQETAGFLKGYRQLTAEFGRERSEGGTAEEIAARKVRGRWEKNCRSQSEESTAHGRAL